MEVAVFDTYVKKKDGGYMHFDIIVTKETGFEQVREFGNAYLLSKSSTGLFISQKDCRFCHVTDIIPRWEEQIRRQGYYIHELEGCH
ncbi:uncharacterized protein DUF2024 [Chitinophaga niastensis]|uniref:Uncharacterized protein DUF2024 n=1 Tax=Chitinophaga niastensis TaxID=536980 RepID=A0A2P8HTS2_CHINA|nr:DUF2024 family protein [Chitinophaga niastensis]PSL49564.1 uncharacterized protein DUF2024 [Chitinophaga niastensis]